MAEWWAGQEAVGELIARTRQMLGKSQYALAEELRQTSGSGVGSPDRTMVARWEKGQRIPAPYWRSHLAMVLGVPPSALDRAAAIARARRAAGRGGELEGGPPQRLVGELVSPSDGVILTGPAAVAPVFEWENPPDVREVSAGGGRQVVTTAEVQALGVLRTRYEEMYRRVGGVPVQPRIVGVVEGQVMPLLAGSYDNAAGRRLMRAADGLVALAGVCAYDAGGQAAAQRYFFGALRLAKASGDRGFGAYVVALLANQAMHRGELRLVVQYTETAVRAGRRAVTPALACDLTALQARALARMGEPAACRRQMRRAEAAAGRIRRDEEPPETGYVQPGLVEIQHAESLRRLGDYRAAQSYAEAAVACAGDSHLRGQVHRFATLATILASRGAVDASLEVAEVMLDRAQGMESGRIADRIRAVREVICSRSAGPEAREFADRVEGQLATLRAAAT